MSDHTKLTEIINMDIDKIDIHNVEFLKLIFPFFIIFSKFETIRKINDKIRDQIKESVNITDSLLKIGNFEFSFQFYESKKKTTIDLKKLKTDEPDIYQCLIDKKIIDEHINEKTLSVRDLVLTKLYDD